MNYRCPQCKSRLNVAKLFFKDVSACRECGQKVVLGDFLAFFMAAMSMSVTAISSLYLLSQDLEYFVAAGYAVSIGMVTGIVVLVLLGRATRFKRVRVRKGGSGATTRL